MDTASVPPSCDHLSCVGWDLLNVKRNQPGFTAEPADLLQGLRVLKTGREFGRFRVPYRQLKLIIVRADCRGTVLGE